MPTRKKTAVEAATPFGPQELTRVRELGFSGQMQAAIDACDEALREPGLASTERAELLEWSCTRLLDRGEVARGRASSR